MVQIATNSRSARSVVVVSSPTLETVSTGAFLRRFGA